VTFANMFCLVPVNNLRSGNFNLQLNNLVVVTVIATNIIGDSQ